MSHGRVLSFESSLDSIDTSYPLTLTKAITDVAILAIPNILVFVATNMNDVVSLVFIGRLGNENYISAVGVGTTILGMIGLQSLYSISVALDTLVAQAFGNKNYEMCGVYLNKAFILLAVSSIIPVVLLLISDTLLIFIGFEPLIANMVGLYTRRMVPFVYFSVIFYFLNRFLNAQQIVIPQMVITGITTALHPLWCYLFIFKYQYGYLGLADAYTITTFANLFILVSYMWYTGCCRVTLSSPTLDIWKDWGTFLRIAIAGILFALLEWWGYYILMLFAGMLPPSSLATNQIITNVDIFFYMFPIGVGSALTALVGNALGQKKADEAKLYSQVAVVMNTALISILVLVCLIFRSKIAYFYSSLESTHDVFVKVIFVAVLSFFFDCTQGCLSRIFVSQGKQIYATLIGGVVYYVVMLPLGYLLIVYAKLDLYGLWGAGACGYTLMVFAFATIIFSQNWEAIAEEISEVLQRKRSFSGIGDDSSGNLKPLNHPD